MPGHPTNRPPRDPIDQFRFFTRLCLREGFTLPHLTKIIVDEMERQAPVESRVYAGICNDKWVDVTLTPWQLKKLEGYDEDVGVATGKPAG